MYVILSVSLKFWVLPETEFSNRPDKEVVPAEPALVVMTKTPLAPLAPYTAAAVASFNTEKVAISSGCKRARSVFDDSMPSININGSTLPEPNDPKPRIKKEALSE